MKMPSTVFSRRLLSWVCGAALGGFVVSAGADVLYAQAPMDGGLGFYANTNSPQQIADDFSLGGAVSLEGISWWGGDGGNPATPDDDFLVRIYSSLSGTGTVLHTYTPGAVTRTTTGLSDGANNTVYQYDFMLASPESLPAGSYHLFVQNLGQTDWFWLQASSNSPSFSFRLADGDPWDPASYDVAFSLNGVRQQSVPEPDTIALTLLAGAALLFARRRVGQAR